MHGLRCSPALLGWTRLLDEWVVGLTRYNRTSLSDPVCWQETPDTVQTLADAATRVRRFAWVDGEGTPTALDDDGALRFELQGCDYTVSCGQQWPTDLGVLQASAAGWMAAQLEQARGVAADGEMAV